MTAWILAAVFLRACLIATHPFYAARDVVADDRLVGLYQDTANDIEVSVSRTTTRGHYRAVFKEQGNRSLYAIVVFRVGARTFADLSAEPVPIVRGPGTQLAAATNILARATAYHQHVVVRIAPGADGVTVWMPLPETLTALWQNGVRHRTEQDLVSIATEPTAVLRELLARHGNDTSLFAQESFLAKAPSR